MKKTVNRIAIPACVFCEDAVLPPSRGNKGVLICLAIALSAVLWPNNASADSRPVLNYALHAPMIDTGIDTDARGRVSSTLIHDKNSDRQRLRIAVAGLDPRTVYQLNALVGDASGPARVEEFTTDRQGAVVIVYSKNSSGRAIGGTQLLPALLDPICNVRELQVVNSSSQIVLRAILSAPSRKHYVVARPLENSGFIFSAAGTLQIKAATRTVRFRFLASGLAPATDYILFANGGAGQILTSDRAGKLKLTTLPQGFSNPLDIYALALSDTNGNLVLSTEGLGIPCALPPTPAAPQAPVNLGAASAFAVLAGSTVTSTGFTIINNGDVGVSAGTAVEGFPPAVINNGGIHPADPAAAAAQLDLTTAYNDAAGRTVAPVSVSGNLGGRTLAPGLYKSTSSLEISSGDLTLNAQGDANAVFIFQIASTLETTSGRKVFLTGNARAANVFWQVGSSATLGTGSNFKGNIMADQSITLNTGATLEGRALARIGGVTLDANTVTTPAP